MTTDSHTITSAQLLMRDTATIAQPDPTPTGATMTVGAGDAKGMPPGLAEEIAGADIRMDGRVRVRLLGYDRDHDVHVPAGDVLSGDLASVTDGLDWIAAEAQVERKYLRLHGSEIWVGGACAALGVIEPRPASDLADELAGMDPADRRVAARVADLPEVEPDPGYEGRAVARARREGVLPPAPVLESIRNWAYSAGQLQLGHLCTEAVNGEDWARKRIFAALTAIDTTRPDGAVARAMSAPM